MTFLALLSPLVATLLGWLALDQQLTTLQLAGVALVAAAVALPQLRTTAAPADVLAAVPAPTGAP